MFALARDNALPFSETIRRTNKRKQPTFAIWSVIGLCIPFACLPLGSATTLYSVLAVTASTLSYVGYVSVSLPCSVSPLRGGIRVHRQCSMLRRRQAVPVLLYLVSGKDLQSEGRASWSLRKLRCVIPLPHVTHVMLRGAPC